MDRVTLKHTDLTVSRICFGTMTFGGQTDEAAAVRMIDRCLEAGINFLDTANVYNKGVSECILGKALRGRRERVVLAGGELSAGVCPDGGWRMRAILPVGEEVPGEASAPRTHTAEVEEEEGADVDPHTPGR